MATTAIRCVCKRLSLCLVTGGRRVLDSKQEAVGRKQKVSGDCFVPTADGQLRCAHLIIADRLLAVERHDRLIGAPEDILLADRLQQAGATEHLAHRRL